MSCDAVPWCTTDHEQLLGGGWEDAPGGEIVRYHERGAGRLIYLVARERVGAEGVTLSPPRISVNGEDAQLEPVKARDLAADLTRLAAIADGVS